MSLLAPLGNRHRGACTPALGRLCLVTLTLVTSVGLAPSSGRATAKGPVVQDIHGFAAFLAAFPADGELHRRHGRVPASRQEHVHPLLIKFWSEVGYGSFGDGFIHFFDPQQYDPIFAEWLRHESPDPTRVPFARTAFGDIFYWRDLRARAAAAGLPTDWDHAGDISLLSVHHRTSAIVSITPFEFFTGGLDKAVHGRQNLYYNLYRQARQQFKRPGPEECFYFVPALLLGGTPAPAHLDHGDCLTHLEILLQLGDQH